MDVVVFQVVVIFHRFEEMVDVFITLSQFLQKEYSWLQDKRFHFLRQTRKVMAIASTTWCRRKPPTRKGEEAAVVLSQQ